MLALTFPKQQILDSSKLKQFADDNFKFYENGRQLSEQVENSVGKGEIACYKQFLLFPTVFSRDLFCSHVKPRLVWARVKALIPSAKVYGYMFNPFKNKPLFLCVCRTSLLKTLVTSNFSFSHSVFYPSLELPVIFIKFEIVVYKLFVFGRV